MLELTDKQTVDEKIIDSKITNSSIRGGVHQHYFSLFSALHTKY